MYATLPPYSVLMSVYFKEKAEFLERSLHSIFVQTIITDDIVIVCDGPLTEELDAVIEKYKNRLHILRLVKNRGLGAALNEGLKLCRYDLIARMDSDDISLPQRCEKELAKFAEDPDLAICSAGLAEFCDNESMLIGERVLPVEHQDICIYSKKRCPFNHPVVMYRKSAVLAVGGYSAELLLFEDYLLWVRLLQAGYRGANCEEILLLMRTSANMYRRRGGVKYAKNMLKFHWWMCRKGWSSFMDFCTSAMPHAIICVLPNDLRKGIYLYLHKKN